MLVSGCGFVCLRWLHQVCVHVQFEDVPKENRVRVSFDMHDMTE